MIGGCQVVTASLEAVIPGQPGKGGGLSISAVSDSGSSAQPTKFSLADSVPVADPLADHVTDRQYLETAG